MNQSVPPSRIRLPIRRWRAGCIALLTILLAGMPALAAPGNTPVVLMGQAAGESRAEPAPSDQPVTAGPWSLTINEILTGDEAAAAVAGASGFNAPPASGMQYVAVRLTVTNSSEQEQMIAGEDFAVTGDSLLVHRFADVTPPEPALTGTVEPGDSLEGWIVAPAVEGEENLLLLYDSVTLTGNWADSVIALDDGAVIPDRGEPAEERNEAGSDIDGPAAIGERVVTADWAISVNQMIEGEAVYNLFPAEDYRTTALGDTDKAGLPYWIGLEVTVTNNRTGGDAAFLPATAILPVDTEGKPVTDALLLTPPEPDLMGGYFPGGSRTGWVLIAMPVGTALDLVRFLPYDTDSDARFITLSGVAGTPARDNVAFAEGDTAVITQDQVNLRAEPSTGSDIVVVLTRGSELEITGEAVEADGYTWYPVRDRATGAEGYVAADFLDTPA